MKAIFLKISTLILIFLPLFAHIPSTEAEVKPIKVLLVPGHDNEVWGAQYGNVKEANMNLAVARRVHKILKKDKRFEVWVTRDNNGYTKEFSDYFTNNREQIISFKEEAKKKVQAQVEAGQFVERATVPHNRASEEMAIKLYGINRWANENQIDAVIHIHFNDVPRKTLWAIGKPQGFAVYMPDAQMPNAKESGQLAANIFIELDKKYKTSTLEKEKGGLIPDQKLIALGSNQTLLNSVRSVLVEYGYVYEKMFRNFTTRHKAYDDLAKRTAEGIKNYFSD
jgi:N-acetylmuramoyl-L-alanine amidase